MNKIQIFKNEEFGDIRTVTIDGEPWFVGKDVAEVLGYSNSRDALAKRVDEEDKLDGVAICDSIGREQKPVLINESGLYGLILSSKLPNAKKFKHWVTSEVLPSIRKTGQYQMPKFSKEIQALLILDERTVKMEKRIDKLEFEIPLYGSEADELSNHVKRKGVQILGGKKTEAYKDTNIRSKVYRDIYDQVKREFGLYSDDGKPKSYKALKRKHIYEAHECIDCYEAPMYIKELINDANAQMSLAE
jgi:prophage antirepressor-like protein|nr:MAG TPA: repressor domain protein [Caudoviricetes sp.]